uniref:X-linked retinitis pigmentosa GTPase regulator n=1 Tax=Gasterosteus aculeatus TaxID=69293 RepID=G3NG81_GASAC
KIVHLSSATGAIFTFGKSSFGDNMPGKFWLKNDQPVHLSCGGEHTAVITENGRLLMFGGNTSGQLGRGFKPAATKPETVKALKSEKVKLVACGRNHTIVCTWKGSVFVTGGNQEGQLGLGHCNNTTSFHLLQSFCDRAPIKMLSAGCNTSAALTEDGRLFMWGDNAAGQIGLGKKSFAAEPTQVDVGRAVMWVSCGYHHSAFVTADGDLYSFGHSANGRLGLQVEQLANHRVPQRVQGFLGDVTQVCCGGEHTVALAVPENNVYTFGRGQYGQLGHGTFQFEADLPKPLEHFCNSSIKHVACGENHTAVITNSGLLYTFGDGRHGKLGLGVENFINQFRPTLCARFLKYSVRLVSCGGDHMLVLAEPRLEEDVPIRESFWEPGDMEMLLLDTLIDPNPIFPITALAARARHRDKVRSLHRDHCNHSLPPVESSITPSCGSATVLLTSRLGERHLCSNLLLRPQNLLQPLSQDFLIISPEGKENSTKQSNKVRTHEQTRKEPSDFESPKLSESSQKTPQSVRKTLTEAQRGLNKVKGNDRRKRIVKKCNINKEEMEAVTLKKNLGGATKQEENKSSFQKTPHGIEITEGNETTSKSGSGSPVEKDAEIQNESTEVRRVEVQVQRVKSTTTKDLHKVGTALGKGQNKAPDSKSAPVGKETTRVQINTNKTGRVKSTPVKVEGELQEVKTTLVRNQSKYGGNTSIKSKSKANVLEKESNSPQMSDMTTDEQKMPDAEKSKLKAERKTGREGGDEVRVEGEEDSEVMTRAKPRKGPSSPEGSTRKGGPVKENVVSEEEGRDATRSQQRVRKMDGGGDFSQTNHENSGADEGTSQQKHEGDEKTHTDRGGEEADSINDLEESVTAATEEEQDHETSEGEETGSNSEEEDEGIEKAHVNDTDDGKEESSERGGGAGSESGESEESSEEEEESEVSEDEDDVGVEDSGSSKEEEEDGHRGDALESDCETEASVDEGEDEDKTAVPDQKKSLRRKNEGGRGRKFREGFPDQRKEGFTIKMNEKNIEARKTMVGSNDDEAEEEDVEEEEENETKAETNLRNQIGAAKQGGLEEKKVSDSGKKKKVHSTKNMQALPPDSKYKQHKETPKPAARTKQSAAGEKKPDDSQQFWDNVLPQYLDLH